jgi:hypothetical protein
MQCMSSHVEQAACSKSHQCQLTVRVETECSGPRRIAGRTRRPRETTPGRRGTTFEIFVTKIIFGASAANYLRPRTICSMFV